MYSKSSLSEFNWLFRHTQNGQWALMSHCVSLRGCLQPVLCIQIADCSQVSYWNSQGFVAKLPIIVIFPGDHRVICNQKSWGIISSLTFSIWEIVGKPLKFVSKNADHNIYSVFLSKRFWGPDIGVVWKYFIYCKALHKYCCYDYKSSSWSVRKHLPSSSPACY